MARINVVTGAASGIGLATANLLRNRGETVIGVDLAGADINVDLASPAGRLQASQAIQTLGAGHIDAVIACAGVAMAAGESVIAVNYFGVVDLLPRLLPLLQASEAPRAVVISSSASLLPSDQALVQACLTGGGGGCEIVGS
ncbi:SDR family NAD(P)-dependent oxidoreductase [Pseudomonas sp. BF-R-19]|uniref:SDR family NAD(P)-dependent oxidoreductase n=1 Tax=Pseudomonas sp. BF-R-19 TaxID=2832397 RepID=UPI001CBB75F4|nr:SDR family NAD(P)-dependent oxidoreductase [Pseudomonas sp. BF-R-19]